MLDILNEVVKSFIHKPVRDFHKDSSTVTPDLVSKDLTNPENNRMLGFFDSDPQASIKNGYYSNNGFLDILIKQATRIDQYRHIAQTTEVANAIGEIVSEVSFNYEEKNPIVLTFDTDNKGLLDAVQRAWDRIVHLTDMRFNIDDIVRKGYIDGQMYFHCVYDKSNLNRGIKQINMIEPQYLYYDKGKNVYKYYDQNNRVKSYYTTPEFREKMEYSPEEIVRVDFGLTDGDIVISYLEYAIKNANMLQNLEDLLIPMRFSRSVSRRVFNIDVGDLSPTKAMEVLKDTERKYKYKKFYNTDTGEISNQQHITSMVEDYWFANRNGGRGTQVDVLDESGNLGELSDILYFCKKLYRSMKVPTSRIDINPDGNAEFGYNADQITVEDMRFFMFCIKLRHVYIKAFKEILRRQLIATKVVSDREYEMIEENIVLKFVNENAFFEKMKLDNFNMKMDIWHNIQDDTGRVLPVKKVFRDIFKMSDEEIEETLTEIQSERAELKYRAFYPDEEEEPIVNKPNYDDLSLDGDEEYEYEEEDKISSAPSLSGNEAKTRAEAEKAEAEAAKARAEAKKAMADAGLDPKTRKTKDSDMHIEIKGSNPSGKNVEDDEDDDKYDDKEE